MTRRVVHPGGLPLGATAVLLFLALPFLMLAALVYVAVGFILVIAAAFDRRR